VRDRGRAVQSLSVRVVAMAQPKRPKSAASRKSNTAAGTQRILVVDDNEDSAKSLSVILEVMGNEVRTAYNGSQALEIAEDFRPALVFLDIGMPNLNGYDTARRLRERPWTKDVVLIALTGWGQEEDKRRAQEAGFNFHVVKPVDFANLRNILEGFSPAQPPSPGGSKRRRRRSTDQ